MTQTQAQRLGTVIQKARERKGHSLRAFAELVGLPRTWLHELEHGVYLDPAPDRLARIAEALEIAPGTIDKITRGSVASSLPGMRTYFRAKYQLSPDEAAQVEAYVERLRGKKERPS